MLKNGATDVWPICPNKSRDSRRILRVRLPRRGSSCFILILGPKRFYHGIQRRRKEEHCYRSEDRQAPPMRDVRRHLPDVDAVHIIDEKEWARRFVTTAKRTESRFAQTATASLTRFFVHICTGFFTSSVFVTARLVETQQQTDSRGSRHYGREKTRKRPNP